MSRTPKNGVSQRDLVARVLIDEIVSGHRIVGSRLPSLRALASRFKTSIFPIEQAMAILAGQGYVERRHGSGNYVQDRPMALKMTDSAVLCMDAAGHVFGELTGLLHDRLHDLGLFASVLDMRHGEANELLRRAQYSESRFIIVHAGSLFPFGALDPNMLTHKHLLAVIAWASDALLDRVHRILVDHAAGSRLLAEHLWSIGHRHVLLAAPDDMIARAAWWDGQGECPSPCNLQGAGFAANWTHQGGRLTPFVAMHEATTGPVCDEDRLLAILSETDAPTAVVGLRDVDAWDVREALRRRRPEALNRLTFIGNGDTPYSQTSHPPFSTQSWNLDQVADLTCRIIQDIEEGKTFATPVVRMIPPRLIVR